MCDFWHSLETFDPRIADPHFCWALLEMETEHYIQIKGGKIIPTGKVMEVSPQAILDRPAPVWKCNFSKQLLEMEADGLLIIAGGVLTLTEEGKKIALDEIIDQAIASAKEVAGGETGSPSMAASAEQVAAQHAEMWQKGEIEIPDDMHAFLLEKQQPGESIVDTIERLIHESHGDLLAD